MQQLWVKSKRHRLFWGLAALILIVLLGVPVTFGSIPHFRLNRYDVKQTTAGTRFIFKLSTTPEHQLTILPDRRVRLVLRRCEAGFLTRLRGYSDPTIGGVQVTRRGDDLVLTFNLRNPADGHRLHSEAESGIVTLDLGPGMAARTGQGRPPGRETIWSGAERLIKEFDPPLRADIPFTPVNRTPVFELLNPEEAKLFQAGEAALYKGHAIEAEELFAAFPASDNRVRALALSRLGEARYLLQKYAEARQAFQEAEQLAPNLSLFNPSAYFAYGDCIARCGDLPAGRRILAQLIAENAEKTYAPMLLVRLGDILLRSDREQEARAIYQTVLTHFPASKAASQARMKLADRQIFTADPDSYLKLLAEYNELKSSASDFQQRENAAFKAALLQAMYGPLPEALTLVTDFEKRFPRSSYVQIMRAMHEDLVALRAQELLLKRDHAQLLSLATGHRDSLNGGLKLPGFLPALVSAFAADGAYRGELELFRYLIDHGAPNEQAGAMLAQMVEDARRIEDPQTTEWAARAFLERYPRHPDLGRIRERLAELQFRRKDYDGVIAQLGWLTEKGTRADSAISYYYLGKAYQVREKLTAAELAMRRFVAAGGESSGSPLLADAHLTVGLGREASGDRNGAIAAVERGLALAAPERKEQFRYRLAEMNARAGRPDTARSLWQQVVKEGKDPEWQALAAQSLANLEVTEQVARARRLMSK